MPRIPIQQRARATVDTIVEAGFIALGRHGYGGTTTRHIAEIAGIGVGSLYEYFANKEDIYAAMNRRFVAEVIAVVKPLIPRLVQMRISDAVAALLAAFESFLCRNDERYLKFARVAANADIKADFEPLQSVLTDLLLQYILNNPELSRLPNLSVMRYIFIQAGIFIMLKYLSDPEPSITYAQLTRGLADMVSHYAAQELALVDGQADEKKPTR